MESRAVLGSEMKYIVKLRQRILFDQRWNVNENNIMEDVLTQEDYEKEEEKKREESLAR